VRERYGQPNVGLAIHNVAGEELDYAWGWQRNALATVSHLHLGEPSRYYIVVGAKEGNLGKNTEFIAEIAGNAGIGVRLKRAEPVVDNVVDRSPADEAKIAPGDRITAIDSNATNTMEAITVFARLRGNPSTTVEVTTLRPSTGEERKLTLRRTTLK